MSEKILRHKDYVAGWLDTTVHDFLEVLSDDGSIRFALVTCLDSNPNPASLRLRSPELKPIASKAQVLGTGLLVPAASLREADARTRIFFGFDEVWFFPEPPAQPKPPAASVIGPTRLNRARFNKIRKWMADSACALALGGGEGLNFVVRASGPASALLGSSIQQPEPALAPA